MSNKRETIQLPELVSSKAMLAGEMQRMARKPKKAEQPSKETKSAAPAQKRPHGRPTVYTEAIAAEILQRLADGESLHSICRAEHMPSKSTVIAWVLKNRAGFSERYAHARAIQLDIREDELFDIVDDARNDWMERASRNGDVMVVVDREHIDRAKLRVETRKWVLTKLRPDRFGDKIEQTHKGDSAFLALWQSMSGGKPHDDS